MSEDYARVLIDALERLRSVRLLPVAARHLAAHADEINTQLRETILAQVPAFTQSRNPDVLPDLARHGPQHTDEIVRLLSGGAVGDFGFVREHAQRRAEQRFPLEATLHAYRCGHKVYSAWVRRLALDAAASSEDAQQVVAAVADFAIEYTDAVSMIASSAYLKHTRLLADVAGDQRAELLDILLGGYDESDGRVASILRAGGYLDGRQSFCVVLALPVDAAEMLNPARARRLADALDRIVPESVARRLVDLRDGKVTIVFSAPRRVSGWTAAHAGLDRRLAEPLSLAGNAVLIGVSNEVPSTSQIQLANRQASIALRLASVGERVLRFGAIAVQRLTRHLAGDELRRLLPDWSAQLRLADERIDGALVATLRAYADADMNTLKAAERLSVHPNTIYARFQKLRDITTLDARTYHGLTELLTVTGCWDGDRPR